MAEVKLRPAEVTLNLYRGDTQDFGPYTIKEGGVAINYSTASQVRMVIKDKIGGTELFSENAADSANDNDWTNGIIKFTIDNTDSSTINSDAVYDVQIILNLEPQTVMYGIVKLQKDVT